MRLTLTAAALVSFTCLAATPDGEAVQAPSVGVVSFENSGAPAAQSAFLRGLALLHDFEYARAAAEFREAQRTDPSFAMAYWGEAMTYNHPVWMEQDLAAARAALAKLAASVDARAARAGSERERRYLSAAETLFGEGSREQRDVRYEAAMAALQEAYPDDVDAAAFHALSILGTAHQGRDFATYMRAAAILESVYPDHRDHPGVLHYLIHCYDDPVHAPLGLRAARRYAAIAPDAGHALHMTSHIFLAMGMWDDVIAANEQAVRTVNAQRTAAGAAESFCGHYATWLVYGYLQRHDLTRARVYIDRCRVEAVNELGAHPSQRADPDATRTGSYLWLRSMLVADTGEWKSGDDVPLAAASDWVKFSAAYGALLGANASGDRSALAAAVAELDRLTPLLIASLDRSDDASRARRVAIDASRLQGQALNTLRSGDNDAGLALLRQAAALEESAPLEFGPPFVAKPSSELLGDELMRLHRYTEAEAAYIAVLSRAPGRTVALEGLTRARKSAGDRKRAPQAGAGDR
jgi:tetratricopeptide (TPR) repeat protein